MVIEQKKLQIIHLFLLTLVHHLCAPFCFHSLGPALHRRLQFLPIYRRSAKHMSIVVGSGFLKKESTASPRVTRVGSLDLTTAMTIQQALTRLHQITTIMIPSENRTLHFSSVISLLHPATSISSPALSFTRHASPLVKFAVGSLVLHLNQPSWSKPPHIQLFGVVLLLLIRIISSIVLSCVVLELCLVIRNRFLRFDRKLTL